MQLSKESEEPCQIYSNSIKDISLLRFVPTMIKNMKKLKITLNTPPIHMLSSILTKITRPSKSSQVTNFLSYSFNPKANQVAIFISNVMPLQMTVLSIRVISMIITR
jgi:hypothetical protein